MLKAVGFESKTTYIQYVVKVLPTHTVKIKEHISKAVGGSGLVKIFQREIPFPLFYSIFVMFFFFSSSSIHASGCHFQM